MAATAESLDRARTRRANAIVRASRKIKASSSAREAGLDEYDGEFLLCRDLGHQWAVQGFYRAGPEVRRRLTCSRCGTESTDFWSSRGERIARRYNYVDGYQVIGHGQISRVDIRVETLNRVEIYADEEQMLNALFRKGKK